MNSVGRNAILVSLLAAATILINLGGSRLWDRDEPRNGRCAVEMFQRGDWIVPTFDGELRAHKPVLLYWCQMLAMTVLGVSEFALRLPSALAGCVTVLLTYAIAQRFVSPRAAIYAACVLATSLMFVVASRIATPDAVLILCQTAAIALFVRFAVDTADLEPDGFRRPHLRSLRGWQWCACYVATGLAVLAKGPIGVLLPLTVIGLFLVWQRWPYVRDASQPLHLQTLHFTAHAAKTAWEMRPGTAILTTAVVAGPWYLAVGLATDGVWLRDFFFTHNVGRAVSPMEGHSGPGPLFYIASILAGTFPWSLLALPLGIALWIQRRNWQSTPPGVILACCWVATYVGFFSLAATKLPSYVSPCYPAVAIVVGWYLGRISLAGLWQRRALGLACVVAAVLGVGLCAAGSFDLPHVGRLGMLIPAGVLLILAEAAAVIIWHRAPHLLAPSLVACATSFTLLFFNPAVGELDNKRPMLDQITETVTRQRLQRVVCSAAPEPSWVFYTDGVVTNSEKVAEDALASWLTTPGQRRGAIVAPEQIGKLRAEVERQGHALVSTRQAFKFSKAQSYVLVYSRSNQLAANPTAARQK